MRKPVLSLCPSLCPRADLKALSGGQDQLHRLTSLLAHRGGLHQGKAHWLDLPLQPLPPCIKRRAAYSVLLTERLYRLPTLLLTGNQLAPVLPSLRHPLLVAHATTMRPSTPCGLVVFIGCLRCGWDKYPQIPPVHVFLVVQFVEQLRLSDEVKTYLATKPEIKYYRVRCTFSYGIYLTELDDEDRPIELYERDLG